MFGKRQLNLPPSADNGMSLAMLGSSTLVGPGLRELTIDGGGGWVVTGGEVVVVVVCFGCVVVVVVVFFG
jgi:putative component of toxin-antitoxin plasmid stabilization module